MNIDQTTPHGQVKQHLIQQVYEPGGARCPTCTQHAQVYRRTINTGMARSLIRLMLHDGRDPGAWVHLPTTLDARSREEGKLAYWGLLEEQAGVERADGGRAGNWRITDIGKAFASNRLLLPKYALVYDGRLLGLDAIEKMSIVDCLHNKFNYDDLMAGR